MGARGKQSVSALSVVAPGDITAIERPDPPDHLTDEQANEWLEVVNRMPADWFPREVHNLLAQYCRHVVTARRVAEMIESFAPDEGDAGWLDSYNRLLIMQERESRAMNALARGMRMTQQSTYSPHRGKGTGIKQPHQM